MAKCVDIAYILGKYILVASGMLYTLLQRCNMSSVVATSTSGDSVSSGVLLTCINMMTMQDVQALLHELLL